MCRDQLTNGGAVLADRVREAATTVELRDARVQSRKFHSRAIANATSAMQNQEGAPLTTCTLVPHLCGLYVSPNRVSWD
jgi:hypothetical protein